MCGPPAMSAGAGACGTISGRSRSAPPSSSIAAASCAGRKPGACVSTPRAPLKLSPALPARAERPAVFLYGTLMRGERAHRLLHGRAEFVGDGSVAGRLVSLGRYPGLVAGRGRVRGEVWRLSAPEVLRTLDEYEGYNFRRSTALVTLARGRRLRAMVYRYRGSRTEPAAARSVDRRSQHMTVIPEGDWRRHRWR